MVLLSEVLAQEELGLRPVHVPQDSIAVRWTATSELADPTPFLEGGELLLTTGIEAAGWREEWRDYVARLSATGVAALGLGTGLTHRRTPTSLVRACQEYDLNLLEVPRRSTFVAISRTTARLIEAADRKDTQRALDLQRDLATVALRQGDPVVLLAKLADGIGGAALALAPDGSAMHDPVGPMSRDLDLTSIRDELDRLRPHALRAASSFSVHGRTTVLRPVGLRGRPDHYIAVMFHGRATEEVQGAISTMVSLTSLVVEGRVERRITDRGLRSRALELLLAGDTRTALVVLGAASSETTLPRQIRVIRAVGGGDVIEDALRWLEDRSVLAALTGLELCCVAASTAAVSFGTSLQTQGLVVGIGRPAPLAKISASHQTAGHALADTTVSAPLRTWEQVAQRGLAGLIPTEVGQAFANSFLAPIQERPDLCDVLRSFLRHHGSRGSVAAELCMHRNTVHNRLQEIEMRLDVSLNDPRVRAEAYVALDIRDASQT